MRLSMLSGLWFGPGKSGATFALELDEDDVRALCRQLGRRPFELADPLTARLDATVRELIGKGQLGLEADELVAAGDIEVGRNPDHGAAFHSIEGQGDRL